MSDWWVATTPRGFAVRLALFYGALFLVAGTKLPYFPVWLNDRGLTTGEIAMVVAAPLFVRIAGTPAIGLAADMHGDRRRAVILLAWGAFAAFLLLIPAGGFITILLITILLSVATTSMMPLTETVAMAGVRRHGLDYGRMRLWGSLTFIAASFAAGFAVQRAGAPIVLWLLILGAGATVAAAHLMPPPERDSTHEAGSGAARHGSMLADAARLIFSPRFAIFILAVGAAQASHAVFYTFGVLHWQRQGLSSTAAGMLWAVGVVAEIGLFAWSRAIVARIGALWLLLAGAAAGVLRWALMAADPGLAALFALQALHGLTYGAAHIGAVHWMSERVPQEQAGTAQSLYAAVTHGIAMGIATVAAGSLYAALQGRAYLAMAVLSGVGLAAGLVLHRLEQRPES